MYPIHFIYLPRQQPFWIFRPMFGKYSTSLLRCSMHSFGYKWLLHRFNDDVSELSEELVVRCWWWGCVGLDSLMLRRIWDFDSLWYISLRWRTLSRMSCCSWLSISCCFCCFCSWSSRRLTCSCTICSHKLPGGGLLCVCKKFCTSCASS